MNKITEVTITKLYGYEGNDYTVKLLTDEPVTFIYGFKRYRKNDFLKTPRCRINTKIYGLRLNIV